MFCRIFLGFEWFGGGISNGRRWLCVRNFRIRNFRIRGFRIRNFHIRGFRIRNFLIRNFLIRGFHIRGFHIRGFHIHNFYIGRRDGWRQRFKIDRLGLWIKCSCQLNGVALQCARTLETKNHRLVHIHFVSRNHGRHDMRLLAKERSIKQDHVGHATNFNCSNHVAQAKLLCGPRGQTRKQFILGQTALHGAARARWKVAAIFQLGRAHAHIHASVKQLLHIAWRQRPCL